MSYTSVGAPNWSGRTLGSQTPGVPATLGLNVQMDGGRKMLWWLWWLWCNMTIVFIHETPMRASN